MAWKASCNGTVAVLFVTEAGTTTQADIALEPSVPDGIPPSAQTVYKTLALEGPLTHKELVEITEMPPRTVRYAVSRLKDEGHLGQRCNLMDCRQCFFFLTGNCPGGPDEKAKDHLGRL